MEVLLWGKAKSCQDVVGLINNGRRFHNTDLYYPFSIKCKGGGLIIKHHTHLLMQREADSFLKESRTEFYIKQGRTNSY